MLRSEDAVSAAQTMAHPKCPNCGSETLLSRIEAENDRVDLRTYVCPDCETVLTGLAPALPAAVGR